MQWPILKVIFKSSSTVLSTEPAVSTEGLGSNTSGMSSLEEYSYRPKFAALIGKYKTKICHKLQNEILWNKFYSQA